MKIEALSAHAVKIVGSNTKTIKPLIYPTVLVEILFEK